MTTAVPSPEPAPSERPEAGLATAGPVGRIMAASLRFMRTPLIRYAFLIVVLALLAVALVDQAGTLWREVQKLSVPVLLLALGLNMCGLICSLMVWRELLADLGSRLSIPEAWRIMFIGQLGKYVPGSIWPVIAQSELGADRGIPRSRSALSVLLGYAVMTCSGSVVAAVTLPFAAGGSFGRYFWVLLVIPAGLVALSPPVLNPLLNRLLRWSRQPPLEQHVSYRGLARTLVWALAGWSFNGALAFVLVRQLAGDRPGTLLVSVGGYSLSWVVGFVAIFAPAGAGVREAVLIAVLHTKTTTAVALTVALVTRATAVLCDGLTAAGAAALLGRRRLRGLLAARRLVASE